jgi:hypothetical protein
MIRFFLLQNRQGKTRLSKWYVPPPSTQNGSTVSPEAEKVRIEAEVHRLVTARDKKYTNFIEYNNYKLIYRRYLDCFSPSRWIYKRTNYRTWKRFICSSNCSIAISATYVSWISCSILTKFTVFWMSSCWRAKLRKLPSEKFWTVSSYWKKWSSL